MGALQKELEMGSWICRGLQKHEQRKVHDPHQGKSRSGGISEELTKERVDCKNLPGPESSKEALDNIGQVRNLLWEIRTSGRARLDDSFLSSGTYKIQLKDGFSIHTSGALVLLDLSLST